MSGSKKLNILLALFIASVFMACDTVGEEKEAERTTNLVVLVNESGATGCETAFTAEFRIVYRDVDLLLDIEADKRANINVLVEDGEAITVQVRKTIGVGPEATNTVVADAKVNVRTESRPEDSGVRTVTYCNPFNLLLGNF